jgi:hypothetical protein
LLSAINLGDRRVASPAGEGYIIMPQPDWLRAELDALQAALVRPTGEPTDSATGRQQADAAPDHVWAGEVEKLVHELQGKLSEAAEDAESIVISHPFAALASALLLGIAIGRLMRRN